MKFQKMIATGIIGVMMFLAMCTGAALAAQCPEATITQVVNKGIAPTPDASPYFVKITCPAKFTGERGYFLTDELGEAGFAQLLTAYSLEHTVLLNMSGYASGSLVEEIYLLAP